MNNKGFKVLIPLIANCADVPLRIYSITPIGTVFISICVCMYACRSVHSRAAYIKHCV